MGLLEGGGAEFVRKINFEDACSLMIKHTVCSFFTAQSAQDAGSFRCSVSYDVKKKSNLSIPEGSKFTGYLCELYQPSFRFKLTSHSRESVFASEALAAAEDKFTEEFTGQ